MIKNLKTPFQIEVKRLYLPVVITKNCPKCSRRIVLDLNDDYISYPTLNTVEDIHMYCAECDYEFYVSARITVNIEEVEKE